MKREGAERVAAVYRRALTNVEFTGVVDVRDRRRRPGWSPYEVWRTRVYQVSQESVKSKD